MPNLLSLAAPEVVAMTTSGTSEEEVGIMTRFSVDCVFNVRLHIYKHSVFYR